mgnify:CR=1 FL=1|jgi:hypothetical protein|tara:strand:- start:150 stop:1061 length:912 start_codon:yes stop_codon:yes gene_type:complete
MPHDYSYTGIKNIDGKLKEVTFMPSTIETIDQAFFRFIDEELNISSTTNKGFNKVPVLWVSAERSYQIKRDKGLRDSEGILKLPLITIERKAMKKDPSMKGVAWAHIPEANDKKGGAIVVARRIKQDKTSNFLNADSYRLEGTMSGAEIGEGQLNFPSKSPGKVVYETISMPIPTYVVVDYNVVVRTEYQQQVNEIISPFITRTGQINNFFIEHEGHRFEGFIQGDFGQTSNVAQLNEEERTYEVPMTIKILGYLIGDGPNRERPKLSIRENAVEVKIPREKVIVGDIPDFDSTRTTDLFYKE